MANQEPKVKLINPVISLESSVEDDLKEQPINFMLEDLPPIPEYPYIYHPLYDLYNHLLNEEIPMY